MVRVSGTRVMVNDGRNGPSEMGFCSVELPGGFELVVFELAWFYYCFHN